MIKLLGSFERLKRRRITSVHAFQATKCHWRMRYLWTLTDGLQSGPKS